MKVIGFCDATIEVYAAVFHLQDHNQDCSVIASKTKVALAQVWTISRVELLGAISLS